MPFTADAIAAQQVQDRLKSLQQIIHEVEKKRSQSEQGINTLVKYAQDDNSGQSSQKLKSLYKTAILQAEQEEDIVRKALQKITEIRNIKSDRRIQLQSLEILDHRNTLKTIEVRTAMLLSETSKLVFDFWFDFKARIASNKESIRRGTWMKMLASSAQTLPLFVSKIGEKPPPLCGAVPADPNYIAKTGDMVAALVKVSETNGDWILAEVVSYNHSTSKYEVDDILKEQNQKGRHTLSRRQVIPLPLMRANPETDTQALFSQGTLVLGLFPQTTCFYKALVNKPPATHMDEYELLFEDAAYPEGYSPPDYVAQRYVIAFKQTNKQSTSLQSASDANLSEREDSSVSLVDTT